MCLFSFCTIRLPFYFRFKSINQVNLKNKYLLENVFNYRTCNKIGKKPIQTLNTKLTLF